MNRSVQVVFDSMVPGEDMGEEEEELPFDISGEEIHLEDDDYGVWLLMPWSVLNSMTERLW